MCAPVLIDLQTDFTCCATSCVSRSCSRHDSYQGSPDTFLSAHQLQLHFLKMHHLLIECFLVHYTLKYLLVSDVSLEVPSPFHVRFATNETSFSFIGERHQVKEPNLALLTKPHLNIACYCDHVVLIREAKSRGSD